MLRHMQIGLKQYIIQKKILAAHNDLLCGLSATRIAEQYHFHDYSTYFRLDKNIRTFSFRRPQKRFGGILNKRILQMQQENPKVFSAINIRKGIKEKISCIANRFCGIMT